MSQLPIERLESALRAPAADGRPALVAYLTGGYPDADHFRAALLATAAEADAVEVGVPFSDPMADGATIQASSRVALQGGVTLRGILETLRGLDAGAPLLLMSYLNPLLAYGLERLAVDAAAAGVSAFIVPDLPIEESEEFRALLQAQGLGMVQMITPITAPERLERLCRASRGFVYAVTVTGVTGGEARLPDNIADYLGAARSVAPVPVLAGFGIRSAAQVRELAPFADGVIVGSALIERVTAGDDPGVFLAELRA